MPRYPFDTSSLTDRFGPRGEVAGQANFHTGDDFSQAAGTPIPAFMGGTVSRKWWDAFANGAGAGGNMIQLDHGNGVQSRYAHMLSQSPLAVGQSVAEGQTIGYIGSTGAATGPHLHFEILVNGQFVNPVDYITAQIHANVGAAIGAGLAASLLNGDIMDYLVYWDGTENGKKVRKRRLFTPVAELNVDRQAQYQPWRKLGLKWKKIDGNGLTALRDRIAANKAAIK